MKTEVRLKRIPPPAQFITLKSKEAAVCPTCNVWVTLRARKRNGTFSGIEYATHYEREHGG